MESQSQTQEPVRYKVQSSESPTGYLPLKNWPKNAYPSISQIRHLIERGEENGLFASRAVVRLGVGRWGVNPARLTQWLDQYGTTTYRPRRMKKA